MQPERLFSAQAEQGSGGALRLQNVPSGFITKGGEITHRPKEAGELGNNGDESLRPWVLRPVMLTNGTIPIKPLVLLHSFHDS